MTAPIPDTGRGRLWPPSVGTDGERLFIQLGRPPDEPGQFKYAGAPQSYPAEVRARLAADAKEIIGRYPQSRSAILPLLHLVQAEDSYLTPAGLAFCAEQLGLTGVEIASVASFYTMFRRHPTGEYLVGVCTNGLCAVMGGDAIFEALVNHLGVRNDQTTPDGKITLHHVECNAACDYAPVVMVNWEFFDNQTPESARTLVDALRSGDTVRPTRGAPVCGLRHSQRVLAGFPDDRSDDGQGGPGEPTLAGLRVAQKQDMPAGPADISPTGGRSEATLIGQATPLTPVLSRYWDDPESWTLATYRRHDGYLALQKALDMEPDAVIQAVKDSGLRGRGGAGFPTGTKWSFVPQGTHGAAAEPHYLLVNADESEPGTCKDVPLMFATPHVLIEGIVICCYAIRASRAFIYVRGEVLPVLRRLHAAVAEAYTAGFLGRNIGGSGYDLEVVVHAGAGAYICGEETALIDSLEGRRGQPRLRPPFPAVSGLYGCPTVVNNVESIASVPAIILNGGDWFRSMGTEKSPGFTIYSLSGHVNRPGQYEAPLGITLRELLDYAGGVRGGHRLKFWTPGGSSTPILTDEHLDVPLDYEGVGAVGSMLGTKALQIFDDTACVVRVARRWSEFYKHESCGKCTPCREGTYWLSPIYQRLETGRGTYEDLETLLDIADVLYGKSFCALGDAAAMPVVSSIKYFRDEYIAHIGQRGCPFDSSASVFVPKGGRV